MWKMCEAVERSHSGTLSGGQLKEFRRREGSRLKRLLKACQQGDRGEPPTKKGQRQRRAVLPRRPSKGGSQVRRHGRYVRQRSSEGAL